MIEKVVETIEKYRMIEAGDNIILGLSGGVDSMALLHILLEIKKQGLYDFNLHLVHVNHGVRGELAKRDQKFTEKVAQDLGLPFYTINVSMENYAKEHKITSEEAGRILRYGFFNEVIDSLGQGKIAVAHNLNDQAETLIMRFLRGTGIDGLRGIEHRNSNIIRPILDITREELEAYIARKKIEITEDHTNFQAIYTRNKIRLEIIPYIEENFNPNIIRTLERTAYLAEIDSNFLEKTSEKRYNEIVKKEEKNRITLGFSKFKLEDISIKQRIIRKAILDINSDLQGISESQISLILDIFNRGETGKQVNISNNIIARVSYDDLVIEKNLSFEVEDFKYKLEDKLFIDEIGYKFNVKTISRKDFQASSKKKNTRYFDYDKIKSELFIRNRRNGDRFVPFGMNGSKKIKDYFVDEKIPREERDSIPLIVDGDNIIWVVGYRTSNLYKITGNTERILEIAYEKFNQEDNNGRYSEEGSY